MCGYSVGGWRRSIIDENCPIPLTPTVLYVRIYMLQAATNRFIYLT